MISREAKREMLGEKVAGMWEGNGEHLPRSDRKNLFKRFESADLTRLWRIYARSVDEKVKDWQGEHRANGDEKESGKMEKGEEKRRKKEREEHDWKNVRGREGKRTEKRNRGLKGWEQV